LTKSSSSLNLFFIKKSSFFLIFRRWRSAETLCYNTPSIREITEKRGDAQLPEIDVKGKKYLTNEEGFLAHPEEWDEDVAAALAKKAERIELLTDEHWAVIRYIRNCYLENNLAPMVRKICKTTGFTLKHIYELFPSGPAKGACKLAGLPKPDGCV
jgi:tRNA 2-thiouridine synthesizing protein E